MTIAAFVRRLIPSALKQPVRNYIDGRAWRQQPQLPFAALNLRPCSLVDVTAVMNDAAIGAAFTEDNAKIASVYGAGEVFGGVNPGDRRALFHLIAYFKPKRVLEIGTHVGASTVHIASALCRFVDDGKLTTVDIDEVNGPQGAWKVLGLSAPPASFISRLGLEGITTFVTKPAAEMLQGPERYDLIFLDGDHSAPAVYREISAALKILEPQGLIVLHDFYPGGKPLTPDGGAIKGPSMAADRIYSETDDIVFLPLGLLPWQTKGGGNATSLALTTKRN
ncbi:O-methyltransferase [Bradyrhizobium centrolobii]|nr:class I SAM-dependent methyltransferase [Bradyrhizobium centrolobii]